MARSHGLLTWRGLKHVHESYFFTVPLGKTRTSSSPLKTKFCVVKKSPGLDQFIRLIGENPTLKNFANWDFPVVTTVY